MTVVPHPVDLRDAFFDTLHPIVSEDDSVMILTADHGAQGLTRILEQFPSQAFNVGISEQNMVNVASGLALAGKRVFCYTIANFVTLRCLEQISVSVSGNDLPINLVSVGCGFTYSSDGPTHHGLFDMSAAGLVPGMSVFNASDAWITQEFARKSARLPGANYFRLEKGMLPLVMEAESTNLSDGLRVVRPAGDVMLLATGIMVHRALELAGKLQEEGWDAGVVDVFRPVPINTKKLAQIAGAAQSLVTLEENYLQGGFGSSVCSALQDENIQVPVLRLGIPHETTFAYGNRQWMHEQVGLDGNRILRRIKQWHASQLSLVHD